MNWIFQVRSLDLLDPQDVVWLIGITVLREAFGAVIDDLKVAHGAIPSQSQKDAGSQKQKIETVGFGSCHLGTCVLFGARQLALCERILTLKLMKAVASKTRGRSRKITPI